MRGPALSLAALVAAFPALAAEGGPIRGGEHEGFTRIVLEIEPTTEWSLETDEDRATLHFPGRRLAFSTTGVFDKIPHIRVTDIDTETGHEGTTVAISLGCDCRVSTSFVGARFLAVDVADRLQETVADVKATKNDASDKARAMREAHAVADAEDALVRQITRAADQGIIRFSDGAAPSLPERHAAMVEPVPQSDRPRPRPVAADDDTRLLRTSLGLHRPKSEGIDGLSAQEQISASTVFDRDNLQARKQPSAMPLPGACMADRAFDLTAWADGSPFPDQLARLRTRLVGEFDAPDPDAVRDMARLYVRFGLGAEAEATLDAFPDTKIADRSVLRDLGRVVDGAPVAPTGPLAVDADCPGLHGVWLAAGSVAPIWHDTASFQRMHTAFSEMPADVRGMLAPDIVRRLTESGRIEEARTIYLTAVRPGEIPGPELQLAEARLEAEEGRSAEAVRTMVRLARSNEAAISVAALADLIRVALDTHLPIPEPVATDLATAVLQSRGSAQDARLRGLLGETLAQRGDLPGALAELRRAMSDLPARAGEFAALSVRLVAEADPAIIGNAGYAEAALGIQDLIETSPAGDPARARIAGRLVDLGLPDPAISIAAPGVAAGSEAARIVTARAEIALGDGPAARAALGALASTAAVELRAQAYARSGEYGDALATLDAAGLDAESYAWASGDWKKASDDTSDADRAAMARYMSARAGTNATAAPGADPAAEDMGAAFAAPLPPLERPSLGAARQLLETSGKIGTLVERAIAQP